MGSAVRTTIRVPLAGGVGAVVFDADSEDDVVRVSVGDGPPYVVKARDLSHAFHIFLPPVFRVRTDPNIFISFPDPECCAARKHSRLTGNLSLHPLRVILHHRVRRLVCVGRDALRSRNIHKRLVSGRVRRFRHALNRFQFSRGVQVTFVSPRDVIVHFDSEHMAFSRITNDRLRVVDFQSVRANSHVVRPVPSRLVLGYLARQRCGNQQQPAHGSSKADCSQSPARVYGRGTHYSSPPVSSETFNPLVGRNVKLPSAFNFCWHAQRTG
jgi:hypothetical protein